MTDPAKTRDADIPLVLIVEDEPTQRAIARGYLEQAGYRVVEAEDGQQGLEMSRELLPDLIVLDVVMPRLNGFEVCRQIRDDVDLWDTPVLITTGLDDTMALDQGLEVGASDFLSKPIAWKLLQYRVKFLLRRHQIEVELRDAKNRAEAADRAKSQFLANMSHELRTPLNAIMGFSEVIKDEHLGAIEQAKYRQYAQHIHDSGEHLLGIIGDVLDMSKAVSGNLELNGQDIDLTVVIAGAMIQVGPLATGANVELSNETQIPLPSVHGDARRLMQILVNLLSNAVKFTPDGGYVRVRAGCNEQDEVWVSVQDSGIGIAAEDIPRIFQPFQQLEGALSKTYEGTGLGIPIAVELARLHGGTLSYESAPGVGTTATLKLPRPSLTTKMKAS